MTKKIEGLKWYSKMRLKHLIRVLKKVPKKNFNMHVYQSDMVDNDTESKCGTVCCVLGWAGLDKWFRKRGLKTSCGNVYFGGLSGGYDAGRVFFGLDYHTANELFYQGCQYPENPVPQDAIKLIKQILKDGSL